MKNKKYDVVTFGEGMIRLSPPGFQRIEQARCFDVCAGGGEMNVAVGASRLGLKSAWVTKLPDNPLGAMIRNKAREQGVDTSHILWTKDGRVGIYFLEFGATPRSSKVVYDRSHSAVSNIQPGEVAWDSIFRDTNIFHVSGITPALGKSAAAVTLEALKSAKKNKCRVTYDLNYRVKLWSREEAKRCQTPLMKYVDVLITTEEDTFKVFGIKGRSYEEVAGKLAEKFEFEAVAVTLREDISVLKNRWTAIVWSDGKILTDKTYEVDIIDRVGAGDSFSAGFIYGYVDNDVEKGLKYGNAFAALKHSIPGDLNLSGREEVEAQIQGAGLRIVR